MPVDGAYTPDEARELVYEYLAVPYGKKERFIVERGLTRNQIRRWRKQVFHGSLEHALVPRGSGMVTVEETQAVMRLLSENEQLRERISVAEAKHRRQLATLDEELAVQRRAVDALGKAIGLLHQHGVSKSSNETDESVGSSSGGDVARRKQQRRR